MPDPALQRMRRDIQRHQRTAPRVALDGAWQHMQGRDGIRVGTGATRYSATPGVGQPKVRHARRGSHYPPRGKGEAMRATRRLKLGQQLYIAAQHPAGLLARGIFRRAGFHTTADKAGRRAFEAWRFNPKDRG